MTKPKLKFYCSDPYWGKLIERYADGRKPCNCGQAYYTNCGTAHIFGPSGGVKVIHDNPICKDGCSANMIRAKFEIAKRIYKELL